MLSYPRLLTSVKGTRKKDSGPYDSCFTGDMTADMNETENFVLSNAPELLLVEAATTHTHSFENTSFLMYKPCNNGNYAIFHIWGLTLTIAPCPLSLSFTGQV